MSGQQLFSRAVLASLLRTALLCVWITAVSSAGFSSAALSGIQLFSTAVLAGLLRTAMPCVRATAVSSDDTDVPGLGFSTFPGYFSGCQHRHFYA